MKSIQNGKRFALPGRLTGVSRHAFELSQQRLEDEVLVLGSRIEQTLAQSIQTLRERNTKEAMQLIANDRNLSQKSVTIEADTLTLLGTGWATDHDLYVLASIIEITLELEHIHGHARRIAEINLKLSPEILFDPLPDLTNLAKMTGDMLHQALKAFADKDLDLARLVPSQQSGVNDLYQQIHQALLKAVKADQLTVNQAFYLLDAGQQLECVADRVANICEWVSFSVTGEMQKLKIA